ncbi:MAG: hypothetical protein IPQ09_25215 [Myxococcales bacterium]|nr:hypothetical protein [Myxococcales bacterium]
MRLNRVISRRAVAEGRGDLTRRSGWVGASVDLPLSRAQQAAATFVSVGCASTASSATEARARGRQARAGRVNDRAAEVERRGEPVVGARHGKLCRIHLSAPEHALERLQSRLRRIG